MKQKQTPIHIILAIVALIDFTYADTIGFFGLATNDDKGKVFELLKPLLPSGLGDLQIGDSQAQVLMKRKNADSQKSVGSSGYLYEEVIASEKWVKGNLHFFNMRYAYNAGNLDNHRGLDSILLDGQYVDETKKFSQTRSLISACFIALGNPDRVVAVKSYSGKNNHALCLYWNSGKSPVFLRIISASSIQQNLFLQIKLPRIDEKEGPPLKGTVLENPTPGNFKTFYEQWLSGALFLPH